MIEFHLDTYKVDLNITRHMFSEFQRLQFIRSHTFFFFCFLLQSIYQLFVESSEQTKTNYRKTPQVHWVKISSKVTEFPQQYFSYELE